MLPQRTCSPSRQGLAMVYLCAMQQITCVHHTEPAAEPYKEITQAIKVSSKAMPASQDSLQKEHLTRHAAGGSHARTIGNAYAPPPLGLAATRLQEDGEDCVAAGRAAVELVLGDRAVRLALEHELERLFLVTHLPTRHHRARDEHVHKARARGAPHTIMGFRRLTGERRWACAPAPLASP
eukprot:6178236-Pleurochrysis_carterae.AAC.6